MMLINSNPDTFKFIRDNMSPQAIEAIVTAFAGSENATAHEIIALFINLYALNAGTYKIPNNQIQPG